MRRAPATATLGLAFLILPGTRVLARPEVPGRLDLEVQVSDPTRHPPLVIAQDTTWIADWAFDAPNGECAPSGWTPIDHYVRNDGSNDWSVGMDYDGQGFVTGNAAILRWRRRGFA